MNLDFQKNSKTQDPLRDFKLSSSVHILTGWPEEAAEESEDRYVAPRLSLCVGAAYFGKTGELTYTGEQTRVDIISILLDSRYRLTEGKSVLYGGPGITCNFYKETSDVFDTLKESGAGFHVVLGGYLSLTETLILDFFVDYSHCVMKPEEIEFNIGGLTAGMGFKLAI